MKKVRWGVSRIAEKEKNWILLFFFFFFPAIGQEKKQGEKERVLEECKWREGKKKPGRLSKVALVVLKATGVEHS